MSASSRLAEIEVKMNEQLQELKSLGKAVALEVIAELVSKCPEVTAIRWKQYTPYFNDGEPCVFRVGEVEVAIVGGILGVDPEDLEEEGWYCTYELPEIKQELKEQLRGINKLFSGDAAEKALLAAFDDHQIVTVYADGRCEVEEYYHD